MKLNPSFLRYNMNGQSMLIPVDGAEFHGLIQGNKSVDVIFECLEHGATEEEIVEEMLSRFDGDREIIKQDVSSVLKNLKEVGAIIE